MGKHSVRADTEKRTLYFQASGGFTDEEMRRVLEEYKTETDKFKGEKHLVMADMRGLSVMSPAVAKIFAQVIGYGRSRGTALCFHLSDDTIQSLQAARLARMTSPLDSVTVDVVSPEEAERALEDARASLRESSQ